MAGPCSGTGQLWQDPVVGQVSYGRTQWWDRLAIERPEEGQLSYPLYSNCIIKLCL